MIDRLRATASFAGALLTFLALVLLAFLPAAVGMALGVGAGAWLAEQRPHGPFWRAVSPLVVVSTTAIVSIPFVWVSLRFAGALGLEA